MNVGKFVPASLQEDSCVLIKEHIMEDVLSYFETSESFDERNVILNGVW